MKSGLRTRCGWKNNTRTKILDVTGGVQTIHRTKDGLGVCLGDAFGLAEAICHFEKAEEKAILKLNRTELVIIRGRCAGWFDSAAVLFNCKVVAAGGNMSDPSVPVK
jgi:hypothetical protein